MVRGVVFTLTAALVMSLTGCGSGEQAQGAASGAGEVAHRLQPAGLRESADALAPSTTALVSLRVTFIEADEVPDRLVHRLSVWADAAPSDQRPITEELGPAEIDRLDVVVVSPPLRGSKYLTRPTRAATRPATRGRRSRSTGGCGPRSATP